MRLLLIGVLFTQARELYAIDAHRVLQSWVVQSGDKPFWILLREKKNKGGKIGMRGWGLQDELCFLEPRSPLI